MYPKNNKDKQYSTLLEYLKKEEPEYYARFRDNYHAKKSLFPDLTENQYLLHVLQAAPKKTRNKFERLDNSLVSQEEIEELSRIINSSSKLKEIAKKYSSIKSFSSGYITKKDKRQLEKKVVEDLYQNMNEDDKKKYNPSRLTIIMPKLNLGPWRKTGGNLGSNDIYGFISNNRDLFEGHEQIAERMLESYYRSKLQSEKTIGGAKKTLETL